MLYCNFYFITLLREKALTSLMSLFTKLIPLQRRNRNRAAKSSTHLKVKSQSEFLSDQIPCM